MGLSKEQMEKYGLSLSDATSSDHDKGIVAYKDNFYSIDGFERQKNEGRDTDQGSVFSSSLYDDAKEKGFSVKNFNTATDVEGALAELGGGGSKGDNKPNLPIELSPELQAAHDRANEYQERNLSGEISNNIYSNYSKKIKDGGPDDAGQQQKQAAQVFTQEYIDGLKRTITTKISELQ